MTGREEMLERKLAVLLQKITTKETTPIWVWRDLDEYAVQLVVHRAKYTCEGCKATEELTIHHMVMRPNQQVMGFVKYQRAKEP